MRLLAPSLLTVVLLAAAPSVTQANPPEPGPSCGQRGKVTFDKAGRVDVFCSIHSQMNCVILVLQNPFFAATDSKGGYRIMNIPAGTYKVKAWHERLPGQVKEITIPAEGEVHEDFVVGVANLTR